VKPFFAVVVIIAVVAVGATGVHMGYISLPDLRVERDGTDAPEPRTAEPVTPAAPKARFPRDLAPAAQAKPVPQAAEFKPGLDVHKLVFLAPAGDLHPWQERFDLDWQAERVEETELVVVIGSPKKYFINRIDYPNNAPPITRYQYEIEVSVVAAKTGDLLANVLFKNVPRPVMPRESWETTAIGRAVTAQQIFNWVSRRSKSGFGDAVETNPVVTQMD